MNMTGTEGDNTRIKTGLLQQLKKQYLEGEQCELTTPLVICGVLPPEKAIRKPASNQSKNEGPFIDYAEPCGKEILGNERCS